ncbi:PQQ-dependent sugar dehydrogenase [Segetibacter sp.]|jgi:glucose/arabinose dehydrogenase|uniref:PQQ-dependent sugar dehydrogenase n=1 Tax=Segetibacter sp. TaxID=2231182 RepID=UPI00262639C3|nr:PQQ-dependent sugar dehydrogenase [Segetibacter sp.]
MKLSSIFILTVIVLSNTSCYKMRKSTGGAQIKTVQARQVSVADIALPKGYKIEPVSTGLTFPSAVTFDESGNLYVIETGYSYGEVFKSPKLLRLDRGGNTTTMATGTNNGPWTGVTFYQGNFYIAEGGALEGGRILRISMDGKITPLISNLPTIGDHHTNGPVIKEGYIYFGLGTATNSGIVGIDNAHYGWLLRQNKFHDIPCADITLTGKNFNTGNILTTEENDVVSTGAFSPFGTTTVSGQVIKGTCPCSGSILRIPVSGGNPEVVAWGFRNPYGLALSPAGKLFVTENAYDDRGSRPVWGAGDVLWEIKDGLWYGWPDYSAGKSIINDEEFHAPGKGKLEPLLAKYPNTPPKPTAIFAVHSSSNGFDFSKTSKFGYEGEAFVAQFGDMAPDVGKVMSPVGFKIVRVNVSNGVIQDFAVNRGYKNGPASQKKNGGLERPLSVKFDPAGTSLYVVDYGTIILKNHLQIPMEQTGMIWKITKDGL